MSKKSFINLHTHSVFSLLDGAITIPKMAEKANKLDMGSIAITDHGNMFGAVQLFEQSNKMGLKAILGCELYIAPEDRFIKSKYEDGQPSSYHIILLIQNERGYKNLSQLTSKGYTEGFYYKPRIDTSLLRECNEGLICLTACLKGVVPFNILNNNIDRAKEKALELQSIFDDRLYLEVQANGLDEQIIVNKGLRDISKELSIPLVATNDCHYLNREDAEAHDALLCIQTGKVIEDTQRLKFSSDEFFFKSRSEMEDTFGDEDFSEALDNTLVIADRCNYEMSFGVNKMPVYTERGREDEKLDLKALVKDKAEDGLKERLSQRHQLDKDVDKALEDEYKKRLDYELSIINKMGFPDYFLIVSDLIKYARDNDIPVGPGRGSAAGSLVAYSMGITNLDPIKHDLLFERFLNPDRISMPDIDIDFCINGREEVIKYVSEKYGEDKVSMIITFGTMKAKGVIKDVGRVMGIPYEDVHRISKLIPNKLGISIKDAIAEEPELKKIENGTDKEKKFLKICRSLENTPRHASTHACGVVISDGLSLTEHMPLYQQAGKGEIVTQYTMEQVEKIGLIKFDFLGLKTLTVIKQAIDLVESFDGTKIDIDSIPLDDEDTFRLFKKGRTTGVFQLESSGMKDLLRQLKPESFEDIIALVALYRPGPMDWIPDYIEGKHGRKRITYLHPKLEPILELTHGVAIYQEQILKMARDLAGFSMGEADILRKAIGKKKIDLLVKMKDKFIRGCNTYSGINKILAELIFAFIEPFAGYGFNRSHAACYALIGYQTGWLKAHYPVQFMAALLSQDMGNTSKMTKDLIECSESGIDILPPDINESMSDFSINGNSIRFGLTAIKNIGSSAIEAIIEDRNQNGAYRDIFDLRKRINGRKINKRALSALIQCGALDFTGKPRAWHLEHLDNIVRVKKAVKDTAQTSMFSIDELVDDLSSEFSDVPEWSERERLKRENEILGFYVSGHPLDEYAEALKRHNTYPVCELLELKNKTPVKLGGIISDFCTIKTKKGDRMAIFSLGDKINSIKVLCWPDTYKRNMSILSNGNTLFAIGNLEVYNGEPEIIVEGIKLLEDL